jgi:hypothetical protein
MLGTSLFLAAIVALLAGVLLDGAAGFARAGVHAAADHAIDGVARDAVAAYQVQLAAAIAGDPANALLHPPGANSPFTGTPAPIAQLQPGASPPAALDATLAATATPGPGSDSAFTLVYAVTPTTLAAPACTQNAGVTHDTIAWLQCNGHIQESRLSLRVVVQAYDPGGSLIAQRQAYVTLRLFDEPPYTALSGRLDGTASDTLAQSSAAPTHEGDDGGDTVDGSTQTGSATYPLAGTIFHVRYQCTDGTGSCANAAPADPDMKLHSNAAWSNGNAAAP